MWRQLIELWKSDDLLDQAYIDSFEMMSVAHEMCIEAIRVLREADSPADRREVPEVPWNDQTRRRFLADGAKTGYSGRRLRTRGRSGKTG